MVRRIVVLGGAGLIGTHLCLRLLDEGHEVFCVDIRDSSASPLLRRVSEHPSFRFVRHNVVDPFGIRCDRIYNLSAPLSRQHDRVMPVEALRTDIWGSMNALEIARREHARVVLASSGDVYVNGYRENITDERMPRSYRQLRAEGKRAAEALHRACRVQYGVDTRIARIFNTYGTGCDATDQRVVMRMVSAALTNRDLVVYGSGEQLRTFCWVGDTVEGLVRLMEAEPGDAMLTVNLGSDHEISIRALAEKIVALTGSRSRIVHKEARLDDLHRRMPDLSAARTRLNWTPGTSLTEGLRCVIAYVGKRLAADSLASMSWVEVH